jgi:hypothetical protein
MSDDDYQRLVEAALQMIKIGVFASDRTLIDWHEGAKNIARYLGDGEQFNFTQD